MPRRAVVLGGTGMLAGVASRLVDDGWLVVLPSRRYSPLPDYAEPGSGRALWVQARWERPERLARDTANALGGKADLLVAWVHNEYRRSVLYAVEPLLAPGAPVVEVFDAPPEDKFAGDVIATLPDHPMQQVVLGYVRDGDRLRWLTHSEVVDGVLMAVERAMSGAPTTEHYVGQARAWSAR
ncbi:hypothetical protein [Thermocrispum sp.]|uniref:Short-chain dehydrogenase n=1 Tax=Thermocrispum agreste TaxID=37925 RepID=A0ABD6FIH8_9PSEU|nr:hypothetical protein [Thermocrispum sp.]